MLIMVGRNRTQTLIGDLLRRLQQSFDDVLELGYGALVLVAGALLASTMLVGVLLALT